MSLNDIDVLKANLDWINGICYRSYNTSTTQQTEKETDRPTCDYQKYDEFNAACAEEFFANDFKIECQLDGYYRTELYIPKSLVGRLVGRQGEVIKRIKMETNTFIDLPPKEEDAGKTVVRGRSERNVLTARTRIDVILQRAREREPFTHFISIPINGAEIKEKFLYFRQTVMEKCANDKGVDKSIFQVPARLHLTLATLALLNSQEIDRARFTLNKIRMEVLAPLLDDFKKSLKVRVRGLEYMNDDASAVDVLYAKVVPYDSENQNLLQELADKIADAFRGTGLAHTQMEVRNAPVKLHITLMNSIFRRDITDLEGFSDCALDKSVRRETFDAINILQNFGDYDFGDMVIDSVHLSQRRAKEKEGYYKSSSVISLLQ